MTRRHNLVHSVMLAATIALGFEAAWLGVWVPLGSWIASLIIKPPETVWETLVFQPDGTALLQHYPSGDASHPYGYRNLQGHTVVPPKDQAWLQGASLTGPAPAPYVAWRKATWGERTQLAGAEQVPPVAWYFVHDGRTQGTAFFEGYDQETNARIGYVGTAGFRKDPVPDSERFRVSTSTLRRFSSSYTVGYGYSPMMRPIDPPRWGAWFISDGRVVEVNLKGRDVHVLFEDTENPAISAGLLASFTGPDGKLDWLLAVRTKDRVAFVDEDGRTRRSVSLPAELQRDALEWYEAGDGRALAVVTPTPIDMTGKWQQLLYTISKQGDVEKREQVEHWVYRYHPSQRDWMPWANSFAAFWLCPSALPMDVFLLSGGPLLSQGTSPSNYVESVMQFATDLLAALIGIHLLGCVLAWVSYRHASRYALPRAHRFAWAAFVFLFGLPGWIGFLTHRRWPVLERCPSCTQQVPADRDACSACAKPFPEPALKGIEVFAS